MKTNRVIIGFVGLLAVSAGLTSCAPDYETEFDVKMLVVSNDNQAPINFSREGGTHEIEVETNVPFDNWSAVSNAEWCKVEKRENKVIVSAGGNDIYKMRLGEITIAYGYQSYSIRATQFGLEPVILVGEKNVRDGYIKETAATTTSLTIPVSTNLELDNIIIPDTCRWIRLKDKEETLRRTRASKDVKETEVQFELEQSTDTIIRWCTVTLQSSQNYGYVTTFQIKQQRRGYIVKADEAVLNHKLEASGGTITIPFSVNGPSTAYSYEIVGDAKDWITVVPKTRALRDASESFVIAPNTKEVERAGTITFRSPDKKTPSEFTVTVTQEKFTPVPPFNVVGAYATPGAGFITLNWSMPEKVDFTKMTVSYYDKVRVKQIEKAINNNATTSLVVDGTYECAGEYEFTIKTYGPTGMETEDVVTVTGTSEVFPREAEVKLTVDMLYGNANEPQEGSLAGLVDDNVKTFYHTLWSGTTNGKPHYLQINLSAPLQTFRFEYDSRFDSNGAGDVTRAGIWGSDTPSNESSWVELGKQIFPLPGRGAHTAPDGDIKAAKAYRHIRFIPEARRDADPIDASARNGYWNMAKMYLYKINFEDESWARKELGLN